jgi:hypothetical protein
LKLIPGREKFSDEGRFIGIGIGISGKIEAIGPT